MMHTSYKLNTDELSNGFLAAIQALYPHKVVEITINEANEAGEANALSAFFQGESPANIPDRSEVSRDERPDQMPDYLTLEVDDILMPTREARYER